MDDGWPPARQAFVVIARVAKSEEAEVHVVLERRLPVSVVVDVVTVALVIDLLLRAEGGPDRTVPRSGRGPLADDISQHPFVIGSA